METKNKYLWIHLTGFFLILALPLLNLPPWFSPPDWGKTIVFKSILATMLFLYIAQTLIKGKFTIKTSKVFYALLGLLGIFSLATIFSTDRLFSFFGSPYRSGGFLNFASYIIFAILAFLILKKSDWSKVLNFSLVIGVFVSLIAVFQNFGILSKIFVPVLDQPWSTIGGSTFLAMYLLFLIFISLTLIIKSIKNLDRKWFFYLPALILFTFVVFLTISRAAYLGLIIGMVYFFFTYLSKSKRVKRAKIALGALLVLAILIIAWVNIFPTEYDPQIIRRLSVEKALNDPRFSVWKISSKAMLSKPLLGYGPENFSIAFDQHYDPALPNMSLSVEELVPITWYDRAHNVIFEIGVTAGVPALIIYLGLLTALFWELNKVKKKDSSNFLICHGLQSAFIAYFTANFFGFDLLPTYLLFFLLTAYSMFLITEKRPEKVIKIKTGMLAYPIIAVIFIGLVGFIWFYNIKPFQINVEINKALYSARKSQMEKSIQEMEKILPSDTFLNEYLRSNYVEVVNAYILKNPRKAIILVPRGIEIIKSALEIRPTYTRYWLMLGRYYNILLKNYQNAYPEFVDQWKNEAEIAFQETFKLSPKRQEIFFSWAETYLYTNDFQIAKEKIQKCIDSNPDLGACYWRLALINIYQDELDKAKENISKAEERGYLVNSRDSLFDLQTIYLDSENYEELCEIYQQLAEISISSSEIGTAYLRQAFCYKETGEYEKAKQAAIKALEEQSSKYGVLIKELLDELQELHMAYLRETMGDYGELCSIYQQLADIHISSKDVSEAYFKLATCYKEIGEYEKAKQAAVEALEKSIFYEDSVKSFLESLPI